MKELFRFVSVEKYNSLDEPYGKINIDDVAVATKMYAKAMNAKNEKELDVIVNDFFAVSNGLFNPDPLSINPQLTALYENIKGKKHLTVTEVKMMCNNSMGLNIKTFIEDGTFIKVKAEIVENLYFLIRENKEVHSKIKILYKHLLKLIGLLEKINANDEYLSKILANPSLQWYAFKTLQNDFNKQDNPAKENEGIKKYKGELINKYDTITALKNTKDELLDLHKKNKIKTVKTTNNSSGSTVDKTSFLKRVFSKSSKETISVEKGTKEKKNPLVIEESILSAKTKNALHTIGITQSEIEIYETLNSVDTEIINKSNELNGLLNQARHFGYQGILTPSDRGIHPGIEITDNMKDAFLEFINGLSDNDIPVDAPLTPSGKGFAKILGEGRLLRVEEKYVGCKLANLSSVLTIPAHAKKVYEERSFIKTTSTIESESDESTFDETTSESKNQNNLSHEIDTIQKVDMSIEAGLSVSANYGPVSVEGSSKFSTNLSNSETTNSASSYARDVTQRAIKRIERKNRETIKTEQTLENEIKNTEQYDNNTTNHSVGIYQWINEVYKASLVQYESRLLLEFMVPEPGNMLLYAASTPYVSGGNALPIPPIPFKIGVDDIKPENYKQFIRNWSATDILPPPPMTIVIGKSFSGPDKTDNTITPMHIKFTDESITIPEGYNLDHVLGEFSCSTLFSEENSKTHAPFAILIGNMRQIIENSVADAEIDFPFNSNNYNGNLPVAITGLQARTFVMTLRLFCIASPQAIDKWKMETYSKLKQAYQLQLDTYNDELALSRQRSFLSGSLTDNATKNRQTEKEELKRGCISILTNQSFELFDAINDPPNRIPTVKFDQVKSEGDYIRFFETAFEWTQMTYSLYPYFWANPKKTWQRSLNLKVDDPKHEEFLKSGFARVVIPVRPEFQNAILQYMETGAIWNGKDPDDIDLTDAMYIQISTEIMERQGQLQQEPQELDSWEYEIPTNHQIISNGLPVSFPKPFI